MFTRDDASACIHFTAADICYIIVCCLAWRQVLDVLFFQIKWTQMWEREWEQERVEDLAWALHHKQNEQAVNRCSSVPSIMCYIYALNVLMRSAWSLRVFCWDRKCVCVYVVRRTQGT